MDTIRQTLTVIGLAAGLAIQGCTYAPQTVDLEQKQGVLERWNRCLQRFESNAAHYCDGHRRDVLASYPAHMESQIDLLLRQKVNSKRASTLMRTGMGELMDASRAAPVDAVSGSGTNAE